MADARAGAGPCLALVLAALGFAHLWAALGCAHVVPWLPPAFRPCRSAVVALPADLGADFRWRAQVFLRAAGEERAALDLVVEKQSGRLVLVAFDRAGMRVLSAVQEGPALRVDPAPSRRRPVSAETLLADLRRLRVPATIEPGIVVVREQTQAGAPLVRVLDPRCDTESVYVTLEEGPLP